MTDKQELLRKQLLVKIHVHKEYKIRRDLDVWEEFLQNTFKISSSAFLSINELKTLLSILNKKEVTVNKIDNIGRAIINNKTNKSTKQIIYLKYLLKDVRMPIINFYLLCKKTLKKKIYSLNELNKKDCTTMIIVLEKIAINKARKH